MTAIVRLARGGGRGYVFVETSDITTPPVGASMQSAGAEPDREEGEEIMRGGSVLERTLDAMLRNEIVENSRLISEALNAMAAFEVRPEKAIAEFGLQFSAEGDVYVVKCAAEATIKVSIEWQLGRGGT